jgi:chromosome segregation ATPase
MSDVVDFSFLSGQVLGVERELRLIRLQVDNLSSRLASLDTRTASLEQNFHSLVSEVSRGFGQAQQQATRNEKRLEVLDAGLSALRTAIDDSTEKIVAAVQVQR